jgi:hypothetical protein
LLAYSLVSQIFGFGFGTRVRSLPDALRIATPGILNEEDKLDEEDKLELSGVVTV